MENKNIVHLLSSWQLSGAENVAIEVIKLLKENYNFIYASPDGQIRDAVKRNGIFFLPIKKMNLFNVWMIKKKYKPDVIHAHDVRATLLARAVFGPKKVISHLHVNPHDMNKLTLKAILFLLAQIGIRSIVVVNKNVEEKYIFGKFLKGKTVHIKNIIDEQLIVSKAHEIVTEEFDVVFVGRLSNQKDPIRAIELFYKATGKSKNKIMAIIGDGPLRDDCIRKIKDLNMEQQIKLLGFLENPYPIIKKSKFLLMTSLYEGYPMVALESLVLGVPILTTAVDGMQEIVIDDYNGKFNRDDKEFISNINLLLDDEKLRYYMSENAIKLFKEINSINTFKVSFDSIYQNYLNEGKI